MNSLFMKYSEILFGNSELALRLPNLLAMLLFMVYTFLIFRKSNRWMAISIFAVLGSNWVLLDLFAVARGYGLSFGFMMMALFHFIESFYQDKNKNLILFHVAALLASMSNFTLLTFYATLMCVYQVMQFTDVYLLKKQRFNIFIENKLNAIMLFFSALALYEPVRRVMGNNNLDFGGKSGFYADTIKSLVSNSLHNFHPSPMGFTILKALYTVFVLAALFLFVKVIINKEQEEFDQHKGLFITTLILIIISIAIVSSHFLLGTDYPIARFSVYLYPAFAVHFGLLMHYLILKGATKAVVPLSLLLGIGSLAGFAKGVDLKACGEWDYDKETKSAALALIQYHDEHFSDQKDVKVGINWIFEPSLNYYRISRELDWMQPLDRDGFDNGDDYFYVFQDDLPKMEGIEYEVIHEFVDIKTLVLRNVSKQTTPSENSISDEVAE